MLDYYIVDAFTHNPFGGNPAGVVILDEQPFPNEQIMQLIAAELRYSETAFIRTLGPTKYHARYFTPQGEVDLCGHATIAAFALLYSLGKASGQCDLHTLAGELAIVVDHQVLMQMAAPSIVHTLSHQESKAVYQSVGLDDYGSLPAMIVSTGLPDIMLPINQVEELNQLKPNMEAVAMLTQRLRAVSIHAFALSNDGHIAHVRDFAPAYGIPEESATGTANAALTHYLATQHLIIIPSECTFLQGETMGRPSVITTRISTDGTIYVGGEAYIVGEGKLRI